MKCPAYNARMKKIDTWSGTPAVSARIVSAISRIATVLRAGTWQFATAQGLNPAQVDIIELLAARAEGMRLSWMAQQLGVSNASASDSVASLTAKGLVEKGRAHDDGRAIALRLTAAGRALAESISQATGFAQDAVERLPRATQDELFGSLLALVGSLQQAERFPETRACAGCRHFRPNAHPGSAAPHHCALVDAPLPKALLRLDCPEHAAADPAVATSNWLALERS